MTLIDRTAYPKFKQFPDAKELAELYTPTPEEIKFAKSKTKSHEGFLSLIIMLKSFQRLGYFPHPELVPIAVIRHVRSCLKLQSWVKAIPSERQCYTYQNAIRLYLGVKQYDKSAQKIIAILVAQQAEVKDHPADLINVAIEELVKQRYELPAFSTLDRLIGHIRTMVNNRLFIRVSSTFTVAEISYLDQLLIGDTESESATLNLIKSPPKSAKLNQMKELLAKYDSLMTFGNAKRLLATISLTKVRHFASLARSLDISEFKDINLPKRRTLLLCLLYEAQVKTRDYLVDMFLKRILKIHNNAKQRLQELREKHLKETEELLNTLKEVLKASKEAPDNAVLGDKVQYILDERGGTDLLLEKFEEIAAYNTNNHLPLVWRFYSGHRKILFDLVRSLEIFSTSAEESVINAVKFLLDNEHKRGQHLPAEIDLSFAGKHWQALIITSVKGKKVLKRQQLEICIFSYLAEDFRTGDACVVGSLSYADFRDQLLSEAECKPLMEEYCNLLGYPNNPEDFVEYLRQELTRVSLKVDKICADDITHFITCGVWEAVYILDGLLKNLSDIQPDTLHADTQGQSGPVFALSYLLGIKLMPRIRNWSDYTFVRPSADITYSYIEPLFKDVVNWNLIKTHWYDMMRVVLSIKAGKVMPSTLLRKLNSYSKKNRLYQAFLELGKAVRTMFLLEYISDIRMRQEINAITNIVEEYHSFLDWVFFGKLGTITENDPIEQEKRLKYLDLVAGAIILHNTVDMSLAIQTLMSRGEVISMRHLAALSPYLTRHIKRYGDYVVNLQNIPQPLEAAINLPPEIFET